jgi:hypothetical protein
VNYLSTVGHSYKPVSEPAISIALQQVHLDSNLVSDVSLLSCGQRIAARVCM